MPANKDPKPDRLRVLISGASIAGPALAYWLDRYGVDVTVVERAETVRSGGYPIDLRGPAVDVVERMGILPKLRAAHIDTQRITFVDADGAVIASLKPETMIGGLVGHDIELPRGVLTSVMYDLTRDQRIRYRFSDSIEALTDDGAGVDVRFRSGAKQRFDVIIAADGAHSNTRALVFGPEAPFNRYFGYCFNIFSFPNDLGLSREAVIYSQTGRCAGVYAVGGSDRLQGFLNFAADEPPLFGHSDAAEQIRRTAAIFAQDGWEVGRLIKALQSADDLFFDTVSQIHMPSWSSGRVVLAGDAAHATSFLSGQGSSLAMIGAYVLAGELAAHANPTEAFASYERLCRPFMEANQGLATAGRSRLMPRTQEELEARNTALAAVRASGKVPAQAEQTRQVHNSITLPDYTHLIESAPNHAR